MRSNNNDDPALLPFRRSRRARHAYLDRTRLILSALDGSTTTTSDGGGGGGGGGTTTSRPLLLALPDHNDDRDDNDRDDDDDDGLSGDDRRGGGRGVVRSTSTYALRPISDVELDALLDPFRCNCRLLPSTRVFVMHRVVVGDGDGWPSSPADVTSALVERVRDNLFGGLVVLGVDAVLAPPPSSSSSSSSRPGGGRPPSSSSSSLAEIVGVARNSLIRDSILEPGCAVHGNDEVLDTHVMSRAAVIGCGSVSWGDDIDTDGALFDVRDGSMNVALGPEAGGGRIARVRVEHTMVDVCRTMDVDSTRKKTNESLLLEPTRDDDRDRNGTVDRTNTTTTTRRNVLCPRSSIVRSSRVRRVHLLPRSSIVSAIYVNSSVLLPGSTIRDGCTVSNSLLQWNSTIASGTDASSVFLMERAEVGPHSLTSDSIFGPDSHVSGGEVRCSLFGPNANSHHQSLLIGVLWPLGRGNVGYGSNVGSNHTGRIPDQETSVGEGTFWGLGCVIKFPVDLTSAPYSIIAAGVQLPPQRITFPFSLITDGPGGTNQLTPGWLLHYSPYTIARSEVKFASRRTAKRHDFYTGWKILRAGIMDMMYDARKALVDAGLRHSQSAGEGTTDATTTTTNKKKASAIVYRTDRAVVGLGANQLTEQGRLIGIRAYTSALQRYALRGLLDRLVELANDRKKGELLSPNEALRRLGLDGVDGCRPMALTTAAKVVVALSKKVVNWPVLPWNEASHSDADASWEHKRMTLLKELPSILGGVGDINDDVLSALLRKCIELEDDHARRVYESKARDDARGADTVPGYRDVHVAAEKDPVVLMTKKEADDVRRDVRLVEEALGKVARSRL